MAASTSILRTSYLADIISTSVTKLNKVLSEQHAAPPSFHEDAPISLPKEASEFQDAIIDATMELHDLLLDPLTLIYKHNGHNNPVCLQAIARFEIARMIPAGGHISFADVAQKTGLDEQIITRILRHAITMRVFDEPQPCILVHTRTSKMLANSVVNDWLKVGTEEMWPAAVKGFSLSNNAIEPIYTLVGSSPERAVRFANAMKVFSTRPEYDPSYIVENYDWASLGQSQVVDIGGAQGHTAMELAKCFEGLNILVQDMDKVVENAELGVPEELKKRVHFMAHDFFAPQTVQADVFYFRWILHNWADKYCVLILRAQIPALKPGARIIIQDTCMPEPGTVPLWRERDLRAEDLNMGAVFNSRERTGVTQPKGSALGIIEVIWDI
ncbi:hypothetical protein SS1G_14292 [Sclerotinia sclerotiorum 1980 UF-70]|uniref:Uncharacterized protein n=1 Tax=Sclerotinia sclerotiorum (strain ATCC 18683 / 1980 / Ss-1) TaxID=665079 RepID=A7F9L1_SCLS1|nr:hypothetical protein SS1G_14292 [Sclerotinia sclerotiorum 1980 UF-70]EDO00422.1 hypothetical protein SS1G_14292 [Sclerotinia sclerotiorum 1980 UF-70]